MTPEHVEVRLEPAGLGSRFIALVVDFVLVTGVSTTLAQATFALLPVAPGLVDTASNVSMMKPKDLSHWAKRDEIADVVAFLASPAAAGITGQTIAVTGWGI